MSTTGTKPGKQAETQQRTPDELEFIKWMEKQLGREPSEQEINLWVDQARALGETVRTTFQTLGSHPSQPIMLAQEGPYLTAEAFSQEDLQEQVKPSWPPAPIGELTFIVLATEKRVLCVISRDPEFSPDWLSETNKELEEAYAKLNEGRKSATSHKHGSGEESS